MIMDDVRVRSAGPDDEARVLAVITLAFATDPVARWANPDPAAYLAAMPEVASAFGGNGFAHGSVYVTGDGGGAAMWLPPNVQLDSDRLAAIMGTAAAADILPDLAALMEIMHQAHPDEAHWYLPMIGVDPAFHARGLGSALLRHALARCDEDGLPAYLESSNPRNISLYRRHGFEACGQIQVGSSPEIVPMLRRPR